MFGLNKLKEAKQQAEEMRAKLDAMEFEGKSADGMATAVITGSKFVERIEVNESVYRIRTQGEVQQIIKEAINQAILKADAKIREEMQAIMPNIPGLGNIGF